MKVKVSNNEAYQIDFPEDITVIDFKKLLKHLLSLEAFIDETSTLTTKITVSNETGTSTTKKHYKKHRKHRKSKFDRETFVKLLKAHYDHNKDMKGKQKAMNKIVSGIDVVQFLKSATYYKRKFAVESKEVGLKRYPTAQDIWKIPSLRYKK
jgi:hypothetical protein